MQRAATSMFGWLTLATLCGCGAASNPNTPATFVGPVRSLLPAEAAPWLADALVTDRTGQATSVETFVEQTAQARVVCLGEQHDDADHHLFQQAIMLKLMARSQRDGRRLALGMEMVQQPYQRALDDYLHGHLNAEQLRHAVQWKRRWGYDFGFFAPMFRWAHETSIEVLALNAPRELTKKVARGGLDSLSKEERDALPELKLDDEAHRRFFWSAMGFDSPATHHHTPPANPHPANPHPPHQHTPHQRTPPAHHPSGEQRRQRFYTAQVIWDESMASAASAWLKRFPHGRMLLLAGNGHCHHSAIVARIQRRLPQDAARIISVLLAPADAPLPPHTSSDFVVNVPRAPGPTEPPPRTKTATRQQDARRR